VRPFLARFLYRWHDRAEVYRDINLFAGISSFLFSGRPGVAPPARPRGKQVPTENRPRAGVVMPPRRAPAANEAGMHGRARRGFAHAFDEIDRPGPPIGARPPGPDGRTTASGNTRSPPGARPVRHARYVCLPDEKTGVPGKNASVPGKNTKVLGKNTKVFVKNLKVFGKNTKVFVKNLKVFGKNTKVFGKNLKVFGKNTKVFDKNTDVFGKNTDVFGKNTDVFDKNTDVFDKNTDVFDKNTDVFDKNTDVFDKNTDVFGKNTDVFGTRL
jgi:rRNA processing protein Gar1